MNKLIIYLFCIGVLSCQEKSNPTTSSLYNTSSQVTIPELTPVISENLELLGHIWGFLKYHHPNVTNGSYNWDFELFSVLPDYLTTKTSETRDEFLEAWIDDLGKVKPCKDCEEFPLGAKLKPNHKWMSEYDMSQSLSDKLKYIYANRSQGKQHYIKIKSFYGNPVFTHESDYKELTTIDSGYRLLALFRYYSTINYFFPYKHLIGNEWDKILKKYIPVFVNATDRLDYELACLKLITEINDSHATLSGTQKTNERFGKYESAVRVRFIEDQLLVTDFYNPDLNNSNLNIGDIITHINNEPILNIVEKLKSYYPASNEPTRLRRIARNLLRSNEDFLELKIKSNMDYRSLKLKLYTKVIINHEKWIDKILSNKYRLLDGNVGYIPAVSVNDGQVSDIMKLFEDTKGIVIDLRNYPNTTDLLYKLTPYFMSSRQQFVKFTNGNIDHPGVFSFKEPLKFSKSGNYYSGKVVVLVNEYTQSLAEYTAMAYQVGHDVTIIGSQTAGADGEVSYLNLPGGLKTTMTGIGVYYPDGKETQRIGIVPDIEVKPTIASIKNEKDILINKALALVLNK